MKKGSNSIFGKVVAWIHLWPSLLSAIFLVIICFSGTIIVYCDEIIDWVNRDAMYVAEIKSKKLPVDSLLKKFREAYPQRRAPGYIVTYRDPSRTVKFNSFEKEKGLRFVYMDPYSGKIIKDDGTIYFFYVTAHLHAELLLHEPGFWIVAISTIIFLIELITGIILWWPSRWTKKEKEQSFTIKWGAKPKRLNYDLHNVLGFYTSLLTLILTVTGLIIAFKPLSRFTVSAFGGDASHKWEKQLPEYKPEAPTFDLFNVTNTYFSKLPWAQAAQVSTYKLDSSGHYAINFSRRVGLKSSDGCYPVFVNRYTGKDVKVGPEAILQETVENGYWSLHMGTWMGPVGKFITFLGGLFATSLPITGFFIWWNRRFKKGKKYDLSSQSPKTLIKRIDKPSKVVH